MYKYIKSSELTAYDPKNGWTDEDIELHKSIDWKSLDYNEYEVKDDTFVGDAKLYAGGTPITVETTFVKVIRPNPIYSPYYRPIDEKPFDVDFPYVGPMYDGYHYNGYDVHDRYESQEQYDILSR